MTASQSTWDVFISYAQADAPTVHQLATNLHELGLRVFLDDWELGPGDVVQRRLEQGLRESATGVLVVSATSVQRPWVMEEYAVLLGKAVQHGQLLIPVVIEDAVMPEMLATRLWVDFRGKAGESYRTELERLARAIRGERPGPPPRRGSLQIPGA